VKRAERPMRGKPKPLGGGKKNCEKNQGSSPQKKRGGNSGGNGQRKGGRFGKEILLN